MLAGRGPVGGPIRRLERTQTLYGVARPHSDRPSGRRAYEIDDAVLLRDLTASRSAHLQILDGEIPSEVLRLFDEEIFAVFDLQPDLAAITAPTLVITGKDDFITGPICSREIAEGIDRTRLDLIPDCGHFLFVEQPRVAAAVTAFHA